METFWFDFLTKQVPVIIVLGFFCYAMYKYFTAKIEQKDKIIALKDEKIEKLYDKVLELHVEAIGVIERATDAIEMMKK